MPNYELDCQNILELIETRFRFLISHKLYLAQIESGKVETSDIENYIQDIFNIPITLDEFLKHLPLVREGLEDMCRFFAQLRKTILEKDEKAIATLYLIVEYQLKYSSLMHDIVRRKDTAIEDKVMAVFNEAEFLKLIAQKLKSSLPQSYETLSKTLQLLKKTHREIFPGGVEAHQFEILIDTKWEYLLNKLAECLLKFSNAASDSEFMQTIAQLMQQVTELITEEKKSKSSLQPIDTIISHVNKFYGVFPLCQGVMDKINKFLKEVDLKKEIANNHSKFLQKTKKELIKINNLLEKSDGTWRQIAKLSTQALISVDTLATLKQDIEKVNTSINEPIRDDLSIEEHQEYIAKFERELRRLLSELTQINQALNDYLHKIKQELLQKSKEVERKLLLEAEQECKEFMINKRKEYAAFRAEVNKERAKKNEERPAAAVEQVAPPAAALVINIAMQERLQQLKPRHLSLLRAILEGRRGLNYDDIHSLIINHLGGTITEIGNGSSHKRISIESYATEMITNNNLVVGGFSRPHGKAHNSGELSYFNVSLVKTLLENAKITLEVISQLEQKKETDNTKHSMFYKESKGAKQLGVSPAAAVKN